jgi:DNA-directed RNA polymerase specialized sigma24 family protein
MKTQQVLEFVNEAIYARTGSQLNDLQSAIIEGILKKMKYSEIADNLERSEGHVKDVGYKLLQMLSDTFDEPVDKTNLKSVLERHGNLNFCFGNNTIITTCNFIEQQANSIVNQEKPETKKVAKLRKFGLSDEQIAEVLEIDVDDVKNLR